MNRLHSIIILLLLVSAGINVHFLLSEDVEVVADTVRTTFIDTIPYYKPVPKDSFVTRYITKVLPVASEDTSTSVLGDFMQSSDSVSSDSVAVQVPITQKVYRDSLYTAYVSGYQPSLDSFTIHFPRQVTTITSTIRPKQSRWGIGLQVGYGITLSPTPQYSPYIGVGIQYDLSGVLNFLRPGKKK